MQQSISTWIECHARIRPDHVALVSPEQRITYRQLHERSTQAAAFLHGLGLRQGDRLALYTLNSPVWFELFIGAARLGLIVVPLNVRLSAPELQFQLQDSGCVALAVGPEFASAVGAMTESTAVRQVIRLEGATGDWPGLTAHTYSETDDIPESTQMLTPAPSGASLPAQTPTTEATRDPLPTPSLSPESPVLIVYTSGTTGRPKGAVLSHNSLFFNALNNMTGLGLTAEDVILTVLPLFHVGGIGLFATPALLTGGTVVLPRRFEPAQALRLIEQERVTTMMTVPTIMQALLDALEGMEPKPDLSSCRGFISGGAPCPDELFERAAKAGLSYGQGFGMTETAPTVFLQPEMAQMRNLPSGSTIGRTGTIGKPVLFMEVKLVDSDGQEVAPGEVGEICVRGGNLFSGYWNLPEATAQAFTPDGFFRSGDLAKVDSDGYITIMGRRKEMLISGGENVYPLEVEQVLQAHPAVAEVAVVGVPDPKWGEVPGAAFVCHPGAKVTAAELAAWTRERLAGYKVPRHWLPLTELPRTAIGKVIKPEIARLLQEVAK